MKLEKKQEHGAITLFVLVSMLFFMIVLSGMYVNTTNKVKKQEKEIEQIQKQYNQIEINELYEQTYNKYLDIENSANEE